MQKNKLLWKLVIWAFMLIVSSIIIQLLSKEDIWEKISDTLLTLGATVVLGGLLKFLLEDYKKERDKEDSIKKFKQDILSQLRNIYDEVELSRLLIESHKSAKTYGERIRQSIIPSKIALYDIKRTLADTTEGIPQKKLEKMRLSVHFMIAYLQSLAQEYKNKYHEISNLQAYQEGVKKRSIQIFSELLLSNKGKEIDEIKKLRNVIEDVKNSVKATNIPKRLSIVWRTFEELQYLKDFINADVSSNYYKFFIDQYEYCKRIIRSDNSLDCSSIIPPNFTGDDYFDKMVEYDKNRTKGIPATDFNLVMEIYEKELKK